MGGKAFITPREGEPALVVPRLDPSLYFELKRRYLKEIRPWFRLADCPAEAPGKDSYGDLDIIVADPDEIRFESTWWNLPWENRTKSSAPKPVEIRKDVLMHILDAKRYFNNGNSQSFAVPHPYFNNAFVQLDIGLQPVELHAWHVFHQSYGDLWNILGASVRPFGLTPAEEGLFVRDAEIEKLNRKRGRMLLSQDPAVVLKFIGLDFEEWIKGWETELEMFKYATKCRFFMPEFYAQRSELKSNDRKRLAKRPCFRRFVEEFVPSLLSSEELAQAVECNGADDSEDIERSWVKVNRLGTLRDVLAFFDCRKQYDDKHRKWVNEQEMLQIKRELKAQRQGKPPQRSYDNQVIDWFSATWGDAYRRGLNLDMDKPKADDGKKNHSVAEQGAS